ncbi:unnamed protein product [Vitrella brassicaformis CCMP3155]|uniref:Uncharacterized protein n=1 Tax=Vitrella brassicaformis (strain CCMP3155) TaxID=1169540 RepID=A0A0G4H0X2_VITBC|nr:unnamed protein product [Vitrella brassicaformis CCMP3155]|eukprot:CEM37211.1 unnamed protein product [Vitrella brassicaformis CCMP3155]
MAQYSSYRALIEDIEALIADRDWAKREMHRDQSSRDLRQEHIREITVEKKELKERLTSQEEEAADFRAKCEAYQQNVSRARERLATVTRENSGLRNSRRELERCKEPAVAQLKKVQTAHTHTHTEGKMAAMRARHEWEKAELTNTIRQLQVNE